MPISDYSAFDNFILRTPLFTFSYLKTILSEETEYKDVIKNIWKIDIIREAVYLSSSELYHEIKKVNSGTNTDQLKIKKLYLTLLQYLIRMSSRATPFGLFAGVCLGNMGEKTDICLDSPKTGKRHTRLDMNFLCALASDIKKSQQLINIIKFYPNNSLYSSGNCYRYVEYKYDSGKRSHHIVSIEKNILLEQILKLSLNGITKNEVVDLLENSGIDTSDAENYVDDLINSQVIVSEFEPAVTGPEFMEQLIKLLKSYGITGNLPDTLIEIDNMLNQLDELPWADQSLKYAEIVSKLDKTGTKFNKKFIFQTDLIKKSLKCELNRNIAEKTLTGVDVLRKIGLTPKSDKLSDFIKVFTKRYGDEELPLLEVLDMESGIGYPFFNDSMLADVSPLIDNLQLFHKEESKVVNWDRRTKLLLKKYRECIDNNTNTIEIFDSDLKGLTNHKNKLPDSFYTVVYLYGDGNEGDTRIMLETAGGSGAANLNARFCHSDRNILAFVKKAADKEKELAADKILAEIVHLPESRTGNILLRPVFRDYEIPYLAKSTLNEDFQINPGDLLISVKRGRIILRSKKLDKDIFPMLTTAHNYSLSSLPVYNFLCDLQFQGKLTGLSFTWFPFENEFVYYPRVIYRDIILSRAFWRIKTKDMSSVLKIQNESQRIKKLLLWLKNNNIPSVISYPEGDNELYLNLEEIHYCRIFFDIIKKRQIIYLRECLTGEFSNSVKSDEGNYVGQFIISFFRNK